MKRAGLSRKIHFCLIMAMLFAMDPFGAVHLVLAESDPFNDTLIIRVYFENLDLAHQIAVWKEPLESKYENLFN